MNMKCDRCGRECHEDHFAVIGEENLCEWCRANGAIRNKVNKATPNDDKEVA